MTERSFEQGKSLLDEIDNLRKAIDQISKYKGQSLIVSENKDQSGFCINIIYKNGNHHPLYKNMIKAFSEILENELQLRIEEFESL